MQIIKAEVAPVDLKLARMVEMEGTPHACCINSVYLIIPLIPLNS